ncbi:hypothetical protein ONZ45_g1124 [Pleurotus djamor]|nr:hypothetical protein ONZ45_g1124 [Pleurotus djamor]
MRPCDNDAVLDFTNSCVRNLWGAIVPASLVLVFCLASTPKPGPLRRASDNIASIFHTFLTLDEAQALSQEQHRSKQVTNDNRKPTQDRTGLVLVGVAQSCFWLGSTFFRLALAAEIPDTGELIPTLLLAISWFYSSIRLVSSPIVSAPLDLFTLYFVFFVGALVDLSGLVYENYVYDSALPTVIPATGLVVNLSVIVWLLVTVLRMPFNPPVNEGGDRVGTPEDYSTLWGWISFYWIYPLIQLGRRQTLNEDDIWDLSPTLQSRPLLAKFKLTRRILDVIDSKDNTPEQRAKAYIYAILTFLCGLLKSQVNLHHLWFGRRAATRMRSELMACVYEKALKRKDFSGLTNQTKDSKSDGVNDEESNENPASADVGKIVNLMAGDAASVAITASFVYSFYSVWTNYAFLAAISSLTPIFISVATFMVYVLQGNELTISVAFTAIALFAMIRQPLTAIPSWTANIMQTFVNIRRIGAFLDEDEVPDQVSSLRSPGLTNGHATEDFLGLGLENATLKWNELEQTVNPVETQPGVPPTDNDHQTIVESAPSNSGSGSHTADHRFQLKGISVRFPEHQLSVVTGPTACGKTALLMALLGEMTLLEGHIIMQKNPSDVDEHGLMSGISYMAQTPWLLHRNIKDNILFDYPYDEARYNTVLEACALKPDLEILEDGDQTEIGARGVNLSGGQKARVALARAIYARNRYVLLDDPLSAVDSHTARLILDKLFRGPLVAHRTVILVTHQINLALPSASLVVQMNDGRIVAQGTPAELQAKGVLNAILLEESRETSHENLADVDEASEIAKEEPRKEHRKLVEDESRATGSVRWSVYKSYLESTSYWIWGVIFIFLLTTEGLSVLEKLWIRAWGNAYKDETEPLSASRLFPFHEPHKYTMTSPKSVQKLTDSWSLPNARGYPIFYIGVFTVLGLLNVVAELLERIVTYFAGLRASRRIFNAMLDNVVRATFRFHGLSDSSTFLLGLDLAVDTTPLGRMLNRFGRDITTVDSALSESLELVVTSITTLLASILTIGVVFPPFLLPAALLGVAYYYLAVGYLNTGRDLTRMEANSESPLYSDFTELLQGIVTVRAFSAEKTFLYNFHRKVDKATKMWYMIWMTNRWLLVNFDILGETTVLITTLFALSMTDAGLAGLCITAAMNFMRSVYWTCRNYAYLELDLNSIERTNEYLHLSQEAPGIIESNRPPAYWPSETTQHAMIEVKDLVVKYAPDLPPVLHGVSFALKPRERVGVIGRTGSGKSTLAMSLLRFVDPVSGSIFIDGIDISGIGVYDLRSRLMSVKTFIPQDAALFSGTLRENLDPLKEHTDSECLEALNRVHLLNSGEEIATVTETTVNSAKPSSNADNPEEQTTSKSVPITLDTEVSIGGTNFSHGQRQLISMARALLRRSSIIIMDEATSSIDFATDAKIQSAIREEFSSSLLITIAHRLRTIIDYDRLLVLDNGKIAEFDTPYNLLRTEGGIFRQMCLQSGTFAELETACQLRE